MARNNIVDGKVVLVSSLLGLMGLVGYSQYAPMKYAIRGKFPNLSETEQRIGHKGADVFVKRMMDKLKYAGLAETSDQKLSSTGSRYKPISQLRSFHLDWRWRTKPNLKSHSTLKGQTKV